MEVSGQCKHTAGRLFKNVRLVVTARSQLPILQHLLVFFLLGFPMTSICVASEEE